ncbi:MAG: LuxR family transcriptional regulator [Candidatus Kapaibacterium sp.]
MEMTPEQLQELIKLADDENNRGNYAEAERIANEILGVVSTLPQGSKHDLILFRAYALNALGIAASHRGNFSLAFEYYNAALTLSEQFADAKSGAKISNNIGLAYLKTGKYPQALEYFKCAHGLYAETENNDEGIAQTNGNIGLVYWHTGHPNNALDYFQHALNLYRELGNIKGIAINAGNIGLIYQGLGEYPKALDYYNRACTLYYETGNKGGIAASASNIGVVYAILGDYSRALDNFSYALTVAEEIGYNEGIAKNIDNIGSVYNILGDYDRSLEYHNRSLILAEVMGNKEGIASTLANIGYVHSNLGEYTQALESYHRAVVIFEEIGNTSGVASNLTNMGSMHGYLGNHQIALDNYHRSLTLHEEIGNQEGIANSTYNLGIVYSQEDFNARDFIKAEKYLVYSLELYQKIGSQKPQYEIHRALADLNEKQHRWEDFAIHYKEYHELYTEVQNEEVKKQADRFGWERKIAEMEKQKEIEAIKTDADKRLLEETISFQKQSLEHQAREVKNTVDELVRKNSLLQLIQSDLKKIAPHTKREGTDYIDQLFERVTRNITPLESNQQLDKQLTEVHGEFISNLRQKFPDLTTMELKIAALLSMKLTSSNIAAALFLSKRTVESHRFSIRKKMGLGTGDDIYSELAKYSA